MSEARFIELRRTELECSSQKSRECAFLSRCDTRISRRDSTLQELQELHDKLQDEDFHNEEDRAAILEKIATLCVCPRHDEDDDIQAAVVQWETEIQSGVSTAQPKTPAKNRRCHKPIKFEPYTPKSKGNPENREDIDREVRRVLAGKIEIQRTPSKYLYIFSDKRAPDAYKVGRGSCIKRATKEWEECYPGHELLCFIDCPNADLFEKVVHAELAKYRRTHVCDGTKHKGKQVRHQEWFDAPYQDILDSVRAWSFYAIMLYRSGLSINGIYQAIPLGGFSTRHDRWRRWALEEAMRWMNGGSSSATVSPEISMPKKVNETQRVYESDSETVSSLSSPASPSETPGTTPATTPGSFDKKNYGFSISPTPIRIRNNGNKPLKIPDRDDDGAQNRPTQPVERALFTKSKRSSSGIWGDQLPSIRAETPQSTTTSSAASSDADPISKAASMDTPSETSTNRKMQKVLEQIAKNPYHGGTVYLSPYDPERESYKIYYRGRGSARKKDCYSKEPPYFSIECENAKAIQSLVLEEFRGHTHTGTCGTPICKTEHRNWINAPGKDIQASLRDWTALLELGYNDANTGSSKDEDGQRNSVDTTAENRQQKEAREVPRPSDVARAPVLIPRRIVRAATDLFSEYDTKEGGRRAMRMVRRVSTFIKKPGKSRGRRASG